jgi:hypothetical protein
MKLVLYLSTFPHKYLAERCEGERAIYEIFGKSTNGLPRGTVCKSMHELSILNSVVLRKNGGLVSEVGFRFFYHGDG